MKSMLKLCAIMTLSVSLIAGCSSSPAESTKDNASNPSPEPQNQSITFIDTAGGANTQKFFSEMIPKASSELGIKINYVTGSGAEIQQRLSAQKQGEGDIDVLLLKPDGIGNMIEAGIPFETLENNPEIPNISLVEPSELKDALGIATNGKAVPFWHDQFGILYNSDKIKNPPKSWDEFYERRGEWAGHIGMIRSDAKSGGGRIMQRDILLGYGVDFSKPFETLQKTTEWTNGINKFSEFSKAFFKPLASEPPVLFQQFASEDVWITEYAIDYTLWSRDQGLLPKSVKSTFFPSGHYGGAAYLAIPSNAPDSQKELAAKFVNWMLSEETQVKMMETLWIYMGINKYDKVPQTVWNNVPSWDVVKKSRIPLNNNEAYTFLKEKGMDLVK
ncbi:putative spermidine/putrescine transport system substrate-binding protein [Paenibacillus sophorae]|uniref:Extracellular solute-binding protein n=1 Tax=Paenibacillus sophorae TaxID=1333845 RepID=A0A1H8IYL8_9BACL|nr:extracellular solute-binding protein [Paenibacillus sophorae]QWU16147.1 extracellular solute-binding protein [Paenibacillus sophorae]SEN73850.1 putative spermidine/putrescine transport system substrate-binding protein [Paenibacillus sophorae]